MRRCDVGFVATEMASHLRAGAPALRAWHVSLRAALDGDDTGEGCSDGCGGSARGDGRRQASHGAEPGDVPKEAWWEEDLAQTIAAWASPRPRPRLRMLWRAARGGWPELREYGRSWQEWWWERRPGGRRQRQAIDTVQTACRFSEILGAPLAEILTRIGRSIDSDDADEEAREIASAGPAASAHILNAMPLLGVGTAWAMGAEPIAFFTSGILGALVALVGVVMMIAGNVVSARMVAHARGYPPQGCDPALACDLVAAGLEGGAAIPRVLRALGEAAGIDGFDEVGIALIAGRQWTQAWEGVDEEYAPLARVLRASWEEGVSPVPACERAAVRLRQRRAAEARRRAARLNVRLVVPLGAFMLPSFIALGIVPLFVALARGG